MNKRQTHDLAYNLFSYTPFLQEIRFNFPLKSLKILQMLTWTRTSHLDAGCAAFAGPTFSISLMLRDTWSLSIPYCRRFIVQLVGNLLKQDIPFMSIQRSVKQQSFKINTRFHLLIIVTQLTPNCLQETRLHSPWKSLKILQMLT